MDFCDAAGFQAVGNGGRTERPADWPRHKGNKQGRGVHFHIGWFRSFPPLIIPGKLGGAFIAAAAMDFKEEDKKLLKWYEKQLKDLKIPVYMNTTADMDVLKDEKADAVIIATGSGSRKLSVPGADGKHVVDAKDYLSGEQIPGENTVIVGGGLTGCEIAYSIAKQGKHVSIVEMQQDIMNVPGLCRVNGNMLRDLLKFHNVDIYTGASLKEIENDTVLIETDGGKMVLPADKVILSIGYNPEPLAAEPAGGNVYYIGDCVKVGNLLDVIWGAYEIVQKL